MRHSKTSGERPLTDGLSGCRLFVRDDVDAWLAGEDAEQIRWFEFQGLRPIER